MRIRESARVQDGIPLTFATQQGEVRPKGRPQTCLAMSRAYRSLGSEAAARTGLGIRPITTAGSASGVAATHCA